MKSPTVGFDINIGPRDCSFKTCRTVIRGDLWFSRFWWLLFQNYDMDLRVMMMISGLWDLHWDFPVLFKIIPCRYNLPNQPEFIGMELCNALHFRWFNIIWHGSSIFSSFSYQGKPSYHPTQTYPAIRIHQKPFRRLPGVTAMQATKQTTAEATKKEEKQELAKWKASGMLGKWSWVLTVSKKVQHSIPTFYRITLKGENSAVTTSPPSD